MFSFPEASGYEFEGCYVDNASRMVPTQLNANTTIFDPNTWATVPRCAALAKSLGYSLFALQVRAEGKRPPTALLLCASTSTKIAAPRLCRTATPASAARTL